MPIFKSILLFFLAGLCEIGGGYLVWIWVKEGKSVWYAIAGAIVLVLYGLVATLQTASFGRTYAAYGGFFIILSLLWAWKIDGFHPDRFDLIGALVVIAGIYIMFYLPRAT